MYYHTPTVIYTCTKQFLNANHTCKSNEKQIHSHGEKNFARI